MQKIRTFMCENDLMELGDFSEDKLIEYVSGMGAGIGDDCAVLPLSSDQVLLVTTDALLEGTHFNEKTMNPVDLGYKSMAVNLSDIAAMGGVPQSVLISLGLPIGVDMGWCKAFHVGVGEALEKFKVNLVGGDTVRSENGIFINVTVLGKAEKNQVKMRSTAKPGDSVFVTKILGESARGLELLLAGESSPQHLIGRHQRPEPEVSVGIWLGQRTAVNAMMDLSDGLYSDLPKLASSSGVRIEIDVDTIPSDGFIQEAIAGGEDCALLFTASQDLKEKFEQEFSRPLFEIGKVVEGSEVEFLKDGEVFAVEKKPFTHF